MSCRQNQEVIMSKEFTLLNGAVDAYLLWETGDPEPAVTYNDQELPISEICGMLWHCSDIMPNRLISQFEEVEQYPDEWKEPVTYAAGSRRLKAAIRQCYAETMQIIEDLHRG
jgi:hypothetical protein